jgi:hypothetical protein
VCSLVTSVPTRGPARGRARRAIAARLCQSRERLRFVRLTLEVALVIEAPNHPLILKRFSLLLFV